MSPESEKFVCPPHHSGRIDKIIAQCFPEVSRSLIKKAIEEGRVVRADGTSLEPKSKISAGEEFLIDLRRPEVKKHLPYEYPLKILYEDESVFVVNKDSGMVTHPGDGTGPDTLIHALLHHSSSLCPVGAPDRPGIVHRLDKETSGVMVVAKSEQAYHHLVAQFAERQVTKRYLALVCGKVRENEGVFNDPIGRHPKIRVKMCVSNHGSHAITEWRVVRRFSSDYSLVSCRILTGRTHQIRVHFSNANHPLAGDLTYGGRRSRQNKIFERVMLHASELGFAHPVTGERMLWEAPTPPDFTKPLEKISKDFQG